MDECVEVSMDDFFNGIIKTQNPSGYADPIYQMCDGDHIDLSRLVHISNIVNQDDGRTCFTLSFLDTQSSLRYTIPKGVDSKKVLQDMIKAWRRYKLYSLEKIQSVNCRIKKESDILKDYALDM
jgi:hypothetical protein